jgi:hypothetical protein
MSNDTPSQSINISGSTLSGSQIGQAGRDQTQTQRIVQDSTLQHLSQKEVASLLENLENILKIANLSSASQEKALKYLSVVKEEAQAEQPDKRFAAEGLKKVAEVLKDTNETLETGQSVWSKVQPILGRLLPWLGVTMGFFV